MAAQENTIYMRRRRRRRRRRRDVWKTWGQQWFCQLKNKKHKTIFKSPPPPHLYKSPYLRCKLSLFVRAQ